MKKGFLLLIILSVFLFSCDSDKEEVIIYCSLDQIYSEPILNEFEDLTGINVKAVYDTELTKTVGLVNRIIAESKNPQCDVFWNNEISRTILLKEKGLLEKYISAEALDIPEQYKNEFWAGFAARARIIIYNKEKFEDEELPSSVFDLIDPVWKGKAAIAYPMFGTTATHAAALFVALGDSLAVDFFQKIKENDIAILDGNATVRDQVVSGEFWWGLTDTDDANGAIEDGKPVGIIYPDQAEGELGTMLIPNTIALIKSSPNQDNAKKLIDFILRPETEKLLSEIRSAQIPLRKDVPKSKKAMNVDSTKIMEVDYEKVSDVIQISSETLQEIFVK